MIRAILFDLDGTLLDRQTLVRNLIEDQYFRFSAQLSHVTEEDYSELFADLDQRGHTPKPLVYELMRNRLGFGTLPEQLANDYFAQYGRFCVGFPEMTETLATLKECQYKLGLVTNGATALQSSAIHALHLGPVFDSIVISESVGVRKPDAEIFHLSLKSVGVEPAEAVFVGDHPEVDIGGAQRAGMRAIWKRDEYFGSCPNADAVIEELCELPDALDRLNRL